MTDEEILKVAERAWTGNRQNEQAYLIAFAREIERRTLKMAADRFRHMPVGTTYSKTQAAEAIRALEPK